MHLDKAPTTVEREEGLKRGRQHHVEQIHRERLAGSHTHKGEGFLNTIDTSGESTEHAHSLFGMRREVIFP